MSKDSTLVIHEIYASIQGESTFAGLPCTFVRTTGCNLRCVWCDTPQAFHGGTRMPWSDVLAKALSFGTPLVELTGRRAAPSAGGVPAAHRAVRRGADGAPRDERRGRRLAASTRAFTRSWI